MSYEGYEQLLCKNGHYDTADCWYNDLQPCRVCGEKIVWINSVDETNGSFCGECNPQGSFYTAAEIDGSFCGECKDGCEYCDNGRIDGYVELEIEQEETYETCACCGHSKVIEERRYKIPEGKGERVDV